MIKIISRVYKDDIHTKIYVGKKLGPFVFDNQYAKEELISIYDTIENILQSKFNMNKNAIENFIKNNFCSGEILDEN